MARTRDGINELFDAVRKKWVRLTPEEWVRQHMVQYLLELGYPPSLLAVEKEIRLGELKKRCDIVVYNHHAAPCIIIECKEMNTPLSEAVLHQVLRYHAGLAVPFVIITNGLYCQGFRKTADRFTETHEFPLPAQFMNG